MADVIVLSQMERLQVIKLIEQTHSLLSKIEGIMSSPMVVVTQDHESTQVNLGASDGYASPERRF